MKRTAAAFAKAAPNWTLMREKKEPLNAEEVSNSTGVDTEPPAKECGWERQEFATAAELAIIQRKRTKSSEILPYVSAVRDKKVWLAFS